ncbi:MAG: hypothetical protein Q8R98_06490 [Rubrivivax sp.]|nr:hypothetical protein [Rubrivivax sp.]
MAGSLDAICSALDLTPDSQQEQTLLQYLDLLQRWNATYNLTAVRDRDAALAAETMREHIADTRQMVYRALAASEGG